MIAMFRFPLVKQRYVLMKSTAVELVPTRDQKLRSGRDSDNKLISPSRISLNVKAAGLFRLIKRFDRQASSEVA
jgi:hypothetical protein